MCPNCREPMVILELDGVEIDRCLNCGGTWLDAGEIEMITELAGALPGMLSEALESAKMGESGKRKCPRCRRKLRVIVIAAQTPIELDRCPMGCGFWLDPGEMEALAASCEGGETGAVARFFSEMYEDELRSKAKGE